MLVFGVGNSSVSNFSSLEEQLFQYIEEHENEFVQTLGEWVAVQSDSIQPHLRPEITRMITKAAEKLKAIGAKVKLANTTIQQVPDDDQNIKLPSIILAKLGEDPLKPTVCFYGHVDVMPAKKKDGWKTDPYTLTDIGGNLYGRGATDNKGPVLAWIHAVNTFKEVKIDLPVNIKFLIEGMEEAGSIGLEEVIKKEKEQFFSDVDYIVISDNTWLTTKKPALTYGTRGNACFSVEAGYGPDVGFHQLFGLTKDQPRLMYVATEDAEATPPDSKIIAIWMVFLFLQVQGGEKDLHSGSVGGIVQEPMSDLIALLDSLVDSSGHILIPGIYDDVANLTEQEKKLYEPIEFNLEEYKVNIGINKFLYDTKEEILLHLWRFPSLSIHGIEGAFHESGIKTVIPSRVIGKISIRQVPHMNLSTVERQVKQHLKDVFSKRNSPNKLTVSMQIGILPWITDFNDPQFKAAEKAIQRVFKKNPDMIRDGSTIPTAQIFQNITKKSVMMFPIGAADDGEHSQKEKISRNNYINGTKVFASFLLEIAKLHKELHEASS